MTVLVSGVVPGPEGLMVAAALAGLMVIAMGLSGIGRVVKFIPYTSWSVSPPASVFSFIQQLGNFTGIDTNAENALGR